MYASPGINVIYPSSFLRFKYILLFPINSHRSRVDFPVATPITSLIYRNPPNSRINKKRANFIDPSSVNCVQKKTFHPVVSFLTSLFFGVFLPQTAARRLSFLPFSRGDRAHRRTVDRIAVMIYLASPELLSALYE